MRRRLLFIIGLFTGFALLARTRLKALVALLESLGVSVPRPWSPRVEPETTTVGGVAGRLYYTGAHPAILLVPGATPKGVTDPRANAAARALARVGRMVFIPELDLYQQEFTLEDLERIVASVKGLRQLSGEAVTAVGFSYGGSFALVAAATPSLQGQVRRVVTLGAYYNLEGVVQAITTGGSTVGGRFIPWDGHPMAKSYMTARTIARLDADDQEPILAAMNGESDPEELPDAARALYDLLQNEDPGRTQELAARLSPPLRSLIDDFSPSAVADHITASVVAMHSTDDPLVPYGELLRLAEGMPQAETLTVDMFSHVDFDPKTPEGWGSVLSDLVRVWRFTTRILAT